MGTDTIQVYQSRRLMKRGWRWRYVAANGNKMATGGESYVHRGDAMSSMARVCGLPAPESVGWEVAEMNEEVVRAWNVIRVDSARVRVEIVE